MDEITTKQEEYLNTSEFKCVLFRGLKKLIVELTSIKAWVLGAVIFLMANGKLDSVWGTACILGLTGIREIDLNKIQDAINEKLTK